MRTETTDTSGTSQTEAPPVVTIAGLVLVVFQALPAVLALPVTGLFALLGLTIDGDSIFGPATAGTGASAGPGFLSVATQVLLLVVLAAAGAVHLWAAWRLWSHPTPAALLLVVVLLAVWPVADWLKGDTGGAIGWLLFPVLAAGLLVSTPSQRFAHVPPRRTGRRIA